MKKVNDIKKIERIIKSSIDNSNINNLDDTEIKKIINESNNINSFLKELFESISINKEIKEEDMDNLYDNTKYDITRDFIRVYIDLENYNIIFDEDINDMNSVIKELDSKVGMDDPVKMYLREIGKYKVLTPEEEKELFIKYRNGDMTARKKLSEHNLKLVVHIAKRYVGRGLELLDLIQEGNIGLLIAIDKFDVTRGNKLSTYATNWIRQSVTRGIESTSKTIRIPSYLLQRMTKIKYAKENYIKTHGGKEPTKEELASLTGFSIEEIKNAELNTNEVVSLNSPIGEDDHGNQTELMDFVVDNNMEPVDIQSEEIILNEKLRELLDQVFPTDTNNKSQNNKNRRDRFVLEQRFGIDCSKGHTLEEVGKKMNVTRERVRQIEAKALIKLRSSKKNNIVKDFLE